MLGGEGYPPFEVYSRSKTISEGEITMKGYQDNSPSSAVSSYRPRFVFLVEISACILFTLVVSVCSTKLSSSASAASIAHASTASLSASYPVKVFFSKSPESLNNGSVVY